jgi:gliding motility-associated-like protein
MVALPQQVNVTDTLSTSSLNPCLQTNYCDTIKVHGDSVICGNSPSMIFTAFKNRECGAWVQWNISSEATDSLQVLSDTSIKIWFKNINWQGKLYASLPAGKCFKQADDSVAISVIRLQDKIDLGPDTLICSGNSIILHAGKSFSSYQWQDGNTDSVLIVTSPGMYWVHASDFCGNNFADTIIIAPFNVAVSVGPDRMKCNNDTLHLDAPAGFINYRWTNNYNISSTTSRQVIINPIVDTSYHLRVEKWPGCFAYDTVHVKVNRSAIISLGNDTSFCAGQSVTLNAGTGFTTYLWSNGSITPYIEVTAAGMYTVKATGPEGCSSYDTLNVVNVYALPVVTLNQNEELCAGTVRVLDAGSFSSYLWQDESIGRTFNVYNKGDYYVEVTDTYGCKGSDTTHIKIVNDPPAGFLPGDMEICSYGTIELKPSKIFDTYLWSNNSSASSIVIDQPGTYWLQVRDNKNCFGRDTIDVTLKQCLQGLYVPNAFTPNNDGKNDNLKAMLFGVVEFFEFRVYNRFGQLIFQTNDMNKRWDGKFNGEEQPLGTYVWVCRYKLKGEVEKVMRNYVNLIR